MKQIIKKLLFTCGVGKILIYTESEDKNFISELNLLNFETFTLKNKSKKDFYDIVLIEGERDQKEFLNNNLFEIYKLAKKNIVFKINKKEDIKISEIESIFFRNKFRKHYSYYYLNDDFSNLDNIEYLIFEKINETSYQAYTQEDLLKERDLHMDMTRESGARSDGHIIRYKIASEYIRLGDKILDAACGLGYGSHLLLNMSEGKEVLGLDLSGYAVRYSNINFSENNIKFLEADVQNLSFLESESFDFITSFETLEHIPNPELFLKEANRVLKPSGRIMVSVPNKWLDKTGKDPSPYHIHTYTWEKLKKEIGDYFILEKAWSLTMSNYWKDGENLSHPRELKEFDINSNPFENTECILLLAMKDPLKMDKKYIETTWINKNNKDNYVNFTKNYINPYLWKGIYRFFPLENKAKVLEKSKEIIAEYPLESPDYGGSLCVLGYRILENNKSIDIEDVMDKMKNYLEIVPKNEHIYRWQVSICFLIGKIYLFLGDISKAKLYFERCSNFSIKRYSLTLGTKVVESLFILGELEHMVEEGNPSFYFKKALNKLYEFLDKEDVENIINEIDSPVPWGLKEVGDLFDILSKCAWGVRHENKDWMMHRFINFRTNLGVIDNNISYIDYLEKKVKELKNENYVLSIKKYEEDLEWQKEQTTNWWSKCQKLERDLEWQKEQTTNWWNKCQKLERDLEQ